MNEKDYFTQQYEQDLSLTEAFEQLRAVIGDTLDTSDMRGFAEDEDVSDLEYTNPTAYYSRRCSELEQRVSALERQRDDLATALRKAIFKYSSVRIGKNPADVLEDVASVLGDALARLEGEAAKDESQSDSAGQR